jgi:hypothetical protein
MVLISIRYGWLPQSLESTERNLNLADQSGRMTLKPGETLSWREEDGEAADSETPKLTRVAYYQSTLQFVQHKLLTGFDSGIANKAIILSLEMIIHIANHDQSCSCGSARQSKAMNSLRI